MTYDEWVDDALGLFPADEAAMAAPPTPAGIYGALNAKWTPYKGLRKPCDGCVDLVHQLGTDKAPHPLAAYWRRKGPNGERFLCNAHGEEHRRLDLKVTAEHAEKMRHVEHQAKARRS